MDTLLEATALSSEEQPAHIVESGQIKDVEKTSEEMRRYTRQQLELLRFVNVEQQEKLWKEIYSNLGSSASKSYDRLENSGDHKHTSLNSDHKISFVKEESQTTHGMYASKRTGILDDVNGEDSESEEDYRSLQMPAFLVEGEPNFDSGPPEDGLEYLRRVRWETSQIPRVKVAEGGKRNIKEQTAYIPKFPDIAECPSHLLPSVEWENELLYDFSELRRVLSDGLSSRMRANVGAEKYCYFSGSSERREELLSEIAGMDSIERVWRLEKEVDAIEGMSSISRNDFSSILALCAVVDLPLRPSTSSALRSLLRKCASLRSESEAPDPDHLLMLNILVTISGRFFGQLG